MKIVLTRYIFSDNLSLESKLIESIKYYNMEAKLKTFGYKSSKNIWRLKITVN